MIELPAWRFTLLGYQAGFARPLYLLGIVLALAVGGLGLWVALKRRERIRALLSDRLADALAPGVSVLRPALKAGSTALGLVLLSLALAQPQCGSKAELTKRRGIDVVVALDASKSMLARDVAPNRLERAKLELMTLLDELKGDRVGVVVFAGDAFIQCPLTSDYSAAKLFLKAVDPEQMPQGGTNIGAALTLSKQLLDNADRGAKDRVVVLISDGEDLAGEGEEALATLKEANIKIFAVGIGSESGEPIPIVGKHGEVLGYQKDSAGETVVTRLDRAGLAHLADATGGELFYQPRGVAMGEVVARIDKLQKSELESRIAVRYDERFQTYGFPGLALMVLGGLLGSSASRGRRP